MKSCGRRRAYFAPFHGPVGFALLLCGVLADGARAQTTTRESVSHSGAQLAGNSRSAAISDDGRFVAFSSTATNVVPGNPPSVEGVYLRDTSTGQVTRVNFDPSGVEIEELTTEPDVTPDGTRVAFTMHTQPESEVFVRDLSANQTWLVSATPGGQPGSGRSTMPSISDDGRYVAFAGSSSTLVPGDTNFGLDVFVRDVQAGTTALVSRNSAGVQGDGTIVYGYGMSNDARFIAWASNSTNLVPNDTADADVFLRDLQAGTTVLLTPVHPPGSTFKDLSLSADGQLVAFTTDAPLDAADTNGALDVYVHDVASGVATRASVDSAGMQGSGTSERPALSPDGRYVAFESDVSTLVPGDTNSVRDVFVRDLVAGTTRRASISSAGLQGSNASRGAKISAGGQFVAFESDASELVAGDSNAKKDVFRIDRTCTGAISSYCVAKTNSLGCVPSIGSSGMPSLSGADDFHVTASNVLNNKFGMMLWSRTSASVPFFDGIRCVGSPFKRTPLQSSGGSASGSDCTGTYSYDFTQAYMAQQMLGAEATAHAQFWSRDPGFPVPNNIGLTNALRFTICP